MLFCLSLSLRGQGSDKYPIDSRLEECLSTDTNQTTYGNIECISTALGEWDAELNKYYKLLKETLEPASQERLKLAQREWILYRDKEIEFMSAFYTEMDGSMYRIFAADRQMAITRQRALDLISYYETITEGER
jgi:uncharacterized protein YecT (DUF1311 family)